MAYETLKPLDSALVKEIQAVNKYSLYKLDEICKKYDIQYWAAYGTLLGAIRHKGFIPWDDDMDVGMMREDYEKLCSVPKEEWGDDFEFRTLTSDDEFHDMPFGRVYISKSRIQSYRDVYYWRSWSDNKPWSTKLMLDIFIFDYLPDDEALYQKIHKKLFPLLDRRYNMIKVKPATNDKSITAQIKCFLKKAYAIAMRTIYRKPWVHIDHVYRKTVNSYPKGKRIGTYCTTDFNTYNYDDVFPLQTAQFEEITVPIPKNWEQNLIDMYGDYMEFPPEEERGHLDLVYCDLGNGSVHIIDPIRGSLGEKAE